MSIRRRRGEETDKCRAIMEGGGGGRQTAGVKETERETRGFMKTVDTLTALNYRADYSGRVALDSSSGSRADTALQKPDFSN